MMFTFIFPPFSHLQKRASPASNTGEAKYLICTCNPMISYRIRCRPRSLLASRISCRANIRMSDTYQSPPLQDIPK